MNGNKQTTLVVLGTFLIVIAVFWYYIMPLYNDSKALAQTINDKKKVFDEKKQLVLETESLKKDYLEIDPAAKEKLMRILPKDENIVSFLPEMEEMLNKNSLSIEEMNFESFAEGTASNKIFASLDKNVKPIKLFIKTKGSYESFRNFLISSEWEERLSDIASIELAAEKKETNLGETQAFSFTIILYAYWMQ